MYVYMCICVYVYMYMYMYVYIYIYIHIYVHTYGPVRADRGSPEALRLRRGGQGPAAELPPQPVHNDMLVISISQQTDVINNINMKPIQRLDLVLTNNDLNTNNIATILFNTTRSTTCWSPEPAASPAPHPVP